MSMLSSVDCHSAEFNCVNFDTIVCKIQSRQLALLLYDLMSSISHIHTFLFSRTLIFIPISSEGAYDIMTLNTAEYDITNSYMHKQANVNWHFSAPMSSNVLHCQFWLWTV